MLCYAMLCYAMLCYAMPMLCYAMLCYAMLCYAMLCPMLCYVCYAMLCYAMLCYAMAVCYCEHLSRCQGIRLYKKIFGPPTGATIPYIADQYRPRACFLQQFYWGAPVHRGPTIQYFSYHTITRHTYVC